MTDLRTTHRSTVTEDQIDHLGHMNVRFYGMNARRGTEVMLGALGFPTEVELRLIDVYTRHHQEQLLGAELEVRSSVVDVVSSGLRLYHELVTTDGTSLAATFVHHLVAESGGGDPAPLPGRFVDRAAEAITAVPDHGATRSISLDHPPEARAPALEELRARGLAMRKERSIAPEECEDDGVLSWDATPGLTWGGEPFDDRSQQPIHTGPSGEPMGWATMETRMSTRRLPRVGDRIQSFGAAIEVRDKTSHRIQWAYDVERGDVLTTFEVVNLAFDIGGRRAMSIPGPLREIEESLVHPDLVEPTPSP